MKGSLVNVQNLLISGMVWNASQFYSGLQFLPRSITPNGNKTICYLVLYFMKTKGIRNNDHEIESMALIENLDGAVKLFVMLRAGDLFRIQILHDLRCKKNYSS